jgi:hypothetical protein
VNATVLDQQITRSDTGELDGSGGEKEASLLEANVPGLLAAQVLHAFTVGHGNNSRSEASVANLSLTLPDNTIGGGFTIGADFLSSRAEAKCNGGSASVSGSSEIANLTFNGQGLQVSGEPNQTIDLPGGINIKINEQTSSVSEQNGEITVNALHIIVFGVADVIISSAHADISCPTPPPPCPGSDFVTGGGWIIPSANSRANFAVAGGVKQGALWGHLLYIDHGTGTKVKGTGVTKYTTTGETSRHVEGTCDINGVAGTYFVDVADNGEPGRADTFSISLSDGYSAVNTLAGGNIQLHTPCSK